MKFVLKRELFQNFWKTPIEKVREPGRKKRGCRFYNHSKNSMIYAENYQFTNAVCLREAEDVDYCKTIINVVHHNGAVKTATIVGNFAIIICSFWIYLTITISWKSR